MNTLLFYPKFFSKLLLLASLVFGVLLFSCDNPLGTDLENVGIKILEDISGELVYPQVYAQSGLERTIRPVWLESDINQTLSYSISPAQDDVVINESTGIITVLDSALEQTETEYTITVEGTGDYQGQIMSSSIISIGTDALTPLEGSLEYLESSAELGVERNIKALWNGSSNSTSQDVFYHIEPKIEGINIDYLTGEILVSSTLSSAIDQEFEILADGVGIYDGEIKDVVPITISETKLPIIDGELSYPVINIEYNAGAFLESLWSNQSDANQSLMYSLIPESPFIQIGKLDGSITVAQDTPLMQNAQFTVLVEGTGQFLGTLSKDIFININPIQITGDISYPTIDIDYNTGGIFSPIWTNQGDVNQTIVYSISPEASFVSINAFNGEISIAQDTPLAQNAAYTVRADGVEFYGGSISQEISVTINALPIDGVLDYSQSNVSTAISVASEPIVPNWSNVTDSNQTVTYRITPQIAGVSIDSQSGIVTFNENETHYTPSTSFTITAEGNGVYVGETSKEITIFIDTYTSLYAGSSAGYVDGELSVAQFNKPERAVMDAEGNIYFVEYGNSKLRKISADGVVSTIAGNGSITLDRPQGIVLDENNNIFVSDTYHHRIVKITPDGVASVFAGSGTSGNVNAQGTAARFNQPKGLTYDVNTRTLYVADTSNNAIRTISADGTVSSLGGSYNKPYDVAINSTQELYIADLNNNAVKIFDLNTSAVRTYKTIVSPYSISIDSFDNVYVGTTYSYLYKIIEDGTVYTLAGTGVASQSYGAGSSSKINFPSGIVVDKDNNIFLFELSGNTIRKILQ